MRKVGTLLAASSLLLFTGLARAAEPAGAPQPSPEQQKLGYFVGDWTSKGDVRTNPFMPAGPFTSTDHCEWFEGGFSVVCHTDGKGPMGAMKGIGIMGYSTEEKVYTYYGLDSSPMAMTTVPRGKVTGKDWVYDDESTMGGKKIKNRYTMTELSPTEYTFRWQMAGEDGAWTTVMEGKSTKAK